MTFPRLPKREVAWVQVEPGDGVVYRLIDGRSGSALPRYARYLIVERELGVADGFWGCIAAGAVYSSMHQMRPAFPRRGTERSAGLIREDRGRLRWAELLTDPVVAVAVLDDPAQDEIRRLTGRMLPVLSTGIAPEPALLAAAARPGRSSADGAIEEFPCCGPAGAADSGPLPPAPPRRPAAPRSRRPLVGRFFNPTVGIAEDPATGTPAGPLIARLAAAGKVAEHTVIVEQGYAVGRLSRIQVSACGPRIRVGGSGLVVADGALAVLY